MQKRRRIRQLPEAERPREKLRKKGASALSDFELSEASLGSGTAGADVSQIAHKIQSLLRQGPDTVTYESLIAIKGVGDATACQFLASLELSRRHLVRNAQPLLTQQDILARLADIRTKQQEHVVCLSLDGGQRLIAIRTITIGILDAALVHPREVFADAIADRAASIILAHNHPSGNAVPTQKDGAVTHQLAAAGHLLGITLHDHIIVTQHGYYSFRERHLL